MIIGSRCDGIFLAARGHRDERPRLTIALWAAMHKMADLVGWSVLAGFWLEAE